MPRTRGEKIQLTVVQIADQVEESVDATTNHFEEKIKRLKKRKKSQKDSFGGWYRATGA